MKRSRRRLTVVGTIASALLAAGPGPALASSWPVYGADLSNSRSAGGDGPTASQVGSMTRAWSFSDPSGDFTGTPVVAGGILVAGSYPGHVHALDAVTGKERWSKDLGGPINASAAIDPGPSDGGTVYVPVATPNAPRLVALSLADGAPRWSTVLTQQDGASAYGSPTYWNGTVYIGTSGPNGDASTARGSVVALDAATGAVRWQTFTVPPGHDGGAVWSTPAIDTATGRLYVGTGNAYHSPSADTTDAILALDAATGAILGHWAATADDTFAADNPAGPDADFGASPNLLEGASGRRMIGEGAKSGIYWTVDRATLQPVWDTLVGPGSAAGGIVGSTAYDGTRIYGSDTINAGIWALGRDGKQAWSSSDAGTLDFSPVSVANGVLYTTDPSGFLTARAAATGDVLTKLSLGGPTFGGVSIVGRAVYAAVGTGPAPAGPQQTGSGTIVAFGDTSRSGAAQTSGPARQSAPPGSAASGSRRSARIALSVTPRHARPGRRTRFRFRARTGTVPVAGALIQFAGRRVHTRANGRVTIVARVKRGAHRARATKRGLRPAVATVRA
jgi:polyvinyl alcohol dehydrogenase (cytochrome)